MTHRMKLFVDMVVRNLRLNSEDYHLHFLNRNSPIRESINGVFIPRSCNVYIYKVDRRSEDDVMLTVAHELRHAWQYKYGYITEAIAKEVRLIPFESNWVELDARCYARSALSNFKRRYEPQSSAERSEAVRNASFSMEAVLVE